MNSWRFAFPADAALLSWMCFLQFHHFPPLIPRQYEGRLCFPRIKRTLVHLVHQIRTPLSTMASVSRRSFAFRLLKVPFAPFCSGLLRSIMFCGVNPSTFGFFEDPILDLLQAAWAPSSCYLSSVSPKLMGCNCMNCLSLNPGRASEQPGQECLAR